MALPVSRLTQPRELDDGARNTVSVMIAHGNGPKHATLMLAADAVAPVVGALSTLFLHVRPDSLVLFLGFFAGFLRHVATSASHSIAPRQSGRRVLELVGIMAGGAAFALVVTRFTP